MEGKRSKKEPILLARYFKKLGLVVMVLAFIPAIVVKAMSIEMLESDKDLFRMYTLNAFILGLLFVVWSKDKIEDEMTVALRLKAVFWTFIWAVFYVIIKPVIDLVFKEPIVNLTGQELVMSMLFIFLVTYYLEKPAR
jgi:hypothetical protein